jgi:hypothetical protein
VTRPNPLRVVLAVVLLVSAAGFAVASSAERAKERPAGAGLSAPEGSAAREAAERATPTPVTATVAQTAEATSTLPSTTAPEGSPAREAAERARRKGATTASTTAAAPTTAATVASVPTTVAPTAVAPSSGRVVGETLFGVHTESAGATAAGVLALVTAAALVLVLADRRILLGVAALALLFALLDGREALHQHDEARAGLVAAALVLAAAHLAATALSGATYRRRPAIPLPVRASRQQSLQQPGFSRPSPEDDLSRHSAGCIPQGEGDDDDIVKGSDHREKLGDQVDR